ncbi:MAG: hypothetical protein QGI08_10940 [Paracoccaceae bacterium]|jgi:hypothetical protein|nr:hypothetical protein [Paracoccaceae bacterium]MDP7186228.1 hypothetical protein [Paracoccaceae bacterium]
MRQRFEALSKITGLKWEEALAKLHPVLSKERKLRQALSELRKPSAHSLAAPTEFNAERSGAIEIWEAWTAQRQQELTSQLALVLAEKEEILQTAKHEFARKEAVQLLRKAAAKSN